VLHMYMHIQVMYTITCTTHIHYSYMCVVSHLANFLVCTLNWIYFVNTYHKQTIKSHVGRYQAIILLKWVVQRTVYRNKE